MADNSQRSSGRGDRTLYILFLDEKACTQEAVGKEDPGTVRRIRRERRRIWHRGRGTRNGRRGNRVASRHTAKGETAGVLRTIRRLWAATLQSKWPRIPHRYIATRRQERHTPLMGDYRWLRLPPKESNGLRTCLQTKAARRKR